MSRFGKKSAQQLEEEQRQLPAKPKEMLNTRRGRFTINPRQITVPLNLIPTKKNCLMLMHSLLTANTMVKDLRLKHEEPEVLV